MGVLSGYPALIEMLYADQTMTGRMLDNLLQEPQALQEFKEHLLKNETNDLGRCERLAELLALERSQLPPATEAQPPAAGSSAAGQQDDSAAQRQRLDRADQLLQEVVTAITEARKQLEQAKQPSPARCRANEKSDSEGSAAKQDTEAEQGNVEPKKEAAQEATEEEAAKEEATEDKAAAEEEPEPKTAPPAEQPQELPATTRRRQPIHCTTPKPPPTRRLRRWKSCVVCSSRW